MKSSIWSSVALAALLTPFFSCGRQKAPEQTPGETSESVSSGPAPVSGDYLSRIGLSNYPDASNVPEDSAYYRITEMLPAFDFSQDISQLSLAELRILRNTIPARKGYLFMRSDLRAAFERTSWYRKLMEARWYGACEYSGVVPAPKLEYTAEEQAFMARCQEREKQLLQRNYVPAGALTKPNADNIVNTPQFDGLDPRLLGKLREIGFAVVPAGAEQLFHIYEQNDYAQIQNFVTTDLYLQLFHMHFSFLLRSLEETKFLPTLEQMAQGACQAAQSIASSAESDRAKKAARWNAAMFAVALRVLDKPSPNVPEEYAAACDGEVRNIQAQAEALSPLLPAYRSTEFPYSLFRPRGHYTRTESLQRYFRGMQWLQLAPLCLLEQQELDCALIAAFVLGRMSTQDGTPLLHLYRRLLEPISFIIGQPDNLSVYDISQVIDSLGIKTVESLLEPSTVEQIRGRLVKLAETRNVIRPKVEQTCRDKINFLPARLVTDNEILQELVHVEEGVPSKRPFPKGLDVLAATGGSPAERLLDECYHEKGNWEDYGPLLEKLKQKFRTFDQWDASVYNKWLQSLSALMEKNPSYPPVMKLPAWDRKDANTALASWAELKHDAILYAEQPMAAECGGGDECEPPPEPIVVGYVEPKVAFWKRAVELLALTEDVLKRNQLLSDEITGKSRQLRDLTDFLLAVSVKELNGQTLTDQEYRTIEIIGSSVEQLTLTIMDVYDWSGVQGPDRHIAVVADVYTNNADLKRAGILHVAVGNGSEIYVVVEIEGYLFLTKGAVFAYHEFVKPLGTRLTDEEWQKMLEEGNEPSPPEWMDDITVPIGEQDRPKSSAASYSSGC